MDPICDPVPSVFTKQIERVHLSQWASHLLEWWIEVGPKSRPQSGPLLLGPGCSFLFMPTPDCVTKPRPVNPVPKVPAERQVAWASHQGGSPDPGVLCVRTPLLLLGSRHQTRLVFTTRRVRLHQKPTKHMLQKSDRRDNFTLTPRVQSGVLTRPYCTELSFWVWFQFTHR